MPVRRTKRQFDLPGTLKWVWPYGGVDSESTNAPVYAEDVVYLGDSPKDWRARIANGLSATSLLDGFRHDVELPGNLQYYLQGIKGIFVGYVKSYGGVSPNALGFGFGDPGLSASSEAEHQAASQVLSSYRNAVQSFAGLNFAAEFADVISMFTNPVRGLFGHTVDFAHKVGGLKNIRRGRDYAAALGETWLGYKFGVEPLANDLVQAIIASDEFTTRLGMELAKKISGSGSSDVTFGYSEYTPLAYASQRVREGESSEVRYKGKVALRYDASSFARMGGFALPDVIPAVWEAIPFSFLVDYFTNVGDVLYRASSASASPWVTYLDRGTKNTRYIQGEPFRFADTHQDITDGYFRGSASGGTFRLSKTRVSRSTAGELPPVTLRFNLPNLRQIVNLGALTAAINGSKPDSHSTGPG